MSEHHAGTEKGCQRVSNALAYNVLAHMPRPLLKDRYIVSNVAPCQHTHGLR